MPRPRRKSLNELKAQVIVWNHEHPVGTPVIFHPVIGEQKGRNDKTAGEAYLLGDHTAVVKLEKTPGCVALDACEVRAE